MKTPTDRHNSSNRIVVPRCPIFLFKPLSMAGSSQNTLYILSEILYSYDWFTNQLTVYRNYSYFAHTYGVRFVRLVQVIVAVAVVTTV